MSEHAKKLIVPIILIFGFVVLDIRVGMVLLKTTLPKGLTVMGLVLPIAITLILIGVLIQRIVEITRGEEDDLGNY